MLLVPFKSYGEYYIYEDVTNSVSLPDMKIEILGKYSVSLPDEKWLLIRCGDSISLPDKKIEILGKYSVALPDLKVEIVNGTVSRPDRKVCIR